jgi:hypothetical protein
MKGQYFMVGYVPWGNVGVLVGVGGRVGVPVGVNVAEVPVTWI